MLLQKLYLANAAETVDIRVTDGKFTAIAPQLEALPGEEVLIAAPDKWCCRLLWNRTYISIPALRQPPALELIRHAV